MQAGTTVRLRSERKMSSPVMASISGASTTSHSGSADIADGLGAFLVSRGMIDGATLDRARRAARTTAERFDRVLTSLGLLSETDLTAALCEYLGLPPASAAEAPAEPVLPLAIQADFVRRNRVLPLAVGEDALVVGVTDPFNDEPLRALAYLIGRPVSPRLFAPGDFDKAYQALYALAHADTGAPEAGAGEASETDIQRLRDMASEAPTIRLVNQIISDAVEARASDIHVEPTGDTVLVRYRIDGALRTVRTLAPDLRAATTSRLKIMARLDIAERRLPQDGRIKVAVRGIDIDLRVSTIPTAFGESVVLRILDRSRVELDFGKLGFGADHLGAFQGIMSQPNGIILVTGPTGSGKTTTLYTALKMLNRPDRKLFTVEDPIEYQLDRINQVQVHPAIGFDFPHALRSILRQDPDIIMIGEIRDLETARIAVQASLTGHLVLSTLHTNSAAASLARLVDMGIESYLLASTLRGVLAQRLVRRLCRVCCARHDSPEPWVKEIGRRVADIGSLGPADLRKPVGCSACGQTGYAGRTTIAELLVVDAEIERLILSAASDADLELAARSRGMLTMYEAGMAKVWSGITTIDEVLSVTRAA
jgi:general secretion pathway protein E